MPFSYLPQQMYHRVKDGLIELVLDEEVIASMSPEEARSNAQDLVEASFQAEGKTSETIQVIYELEEAIKHNDDNLPSLSYRALLLLLQR